MALLKIPSMVLQSVPLVEDRAADASLPTLLNRTYWLFLNAIQAVSGLMAAAIDTLQSDVAALQSAGFVITERAVQSGLAALALTLNVTNTGLLVEVTDYRHVLRWTGTVWTWGPGEDGRHDIVGLPVDPDDTTGWQLCDGTTVAYLKGDGTTGSFATPDLTSAANKAAYPKWGSPVSGPNAAVAPTFTGASGSTSAVSAGTPSGTVNINTTATTAVTVLSAGAVQVAAQGHTHVVSFTGSALGTHSHTVTPSGTISADGEPRNYELRPWFRR